MVCWSKAPADVLGRVFELLDEEMPAARHAVRGACRHWRKVHDDGVVALAVRGPMTLLIPECVPVPSALAQRPRRRVGLTLASSPCADGSRRWRRWTWAA
jgi:hypothetical protein